MNDPYERRYQVFVSSTFTDLQDERQKVLQAILEMKAFPSGMELFPSANEAQLDFIKREIDSSDYYVLVVAGRYGSTSEDGVSFTEKEYDYAIQVRKPILAFLFRDLKELKGAFLEEDSTARARLNSFRTKIQSSQLVKFYNNPDDLKSQVWHALTHEISLRPRDGWIRGTNRRRFEDLEEIRGLQQRIADLEAELASHKLELDNPEKLLAHGHDTASWEVDVQAVRFGKPVLLAQDTITASWDELFTAIFSDGDVSPVVARNRIHAFCLDRVPEKQTLRLADPTIFLDPSHLKRIHNEVRVQFLGLGYIELDPRQSGTSHISFWKLTGKGSLHLARLLGRIRVSSSLKNSLPDSVSTPDNVETE